MSDVVKITELAQLRAFAHPLRHRIWRELEPGSGATISQLGHRIGTNKGNVAHHLGVLVAAGLARRERSRTVRGGTEHYYVRVAERILVESRDSAAAMFATTADELATDPGALLVHRTLRLTARQAAELRAHLERVINELRPSSDERELSYGVLVSCYVRP
jgi:DNA-binding transcriptional ArsR family regulator